MSDSGKTRVLIVEDELIVALNLSKELESLGFVIAGLATSEEEAVSMAKDNKPDVILMDINLEVGGSGLNAARIIGQQTNTPIIYVTAYSSDKIIALMGRTNPYGYVLKPYNVREIKAVIITALIRFKYEKQIKKSEQRLRVAMEIADLDVLEFNLCDKTFSMSSQSKKFAELGFYKKMTKQQFLSLFSDPEVLDDLLASHQSFNRRARLKTTSSANKFINSSTTVDESKLNNDQVKNKYIDVYLSNIRYKDGVVQIGAIQDVTNQQHDLENLQISDSVFKQMHESVLILDEDDRIQKTNPAFSALTGYAIEDIIGQSITEFLLHSRLEDQNTKENQNEEYQSEVTLKCKDSNLVHAMMTVSDLNTLDNSAQTVITLTDISGLIEAERNLHKIAFTDSLTGFGNRAYLNRLLKRLEMSSDYQGIALLYVDLDSFKQINDMLGHEVGDKVLIEFARRFVSAFRDKDHLVRVGGDEFIAILIGIFTQEELEQIGNKVLKLFVEDFVINDKQLSVSSSIGISYLSAQCFSPNELLKQADSAMYQAKKQGKNTFCFYDREQANETEYRIFVELGLAAAIRNELITVYLQPIVNELGKVTSVEALCRWFDPETGFIPPNVFIPIAEESQLIQSLGFRVLNESFIAKKQLIEAGFGYIVININFSEKQLQHIDTFDTVYELLDQYELEANGFVIEITESVLHENSSRKTLSLLKELGFKFAIDDFGTGYSSLSKLHDYWIDILKIDKSFIDLLFTNTKQNVITGTIIQLGKKLGYKVVAEGVESKEQRDILVEMGCDNMQGYYYAKPMPMHELLRFLS